MFRPVGSLLINSRKSTKISPQILAISIMHAVRQVLAKQGFSSEVLQVIKVATYKNGAITIKCPTTVTAELFTRSAGLIEDVNREIGKPVIKKIKFKAS